MDENAAATAEKVRGLLSEFRPSTMASSFVKSEPRSPPRQVVVAEDENFLSLNAATPFENFNSGSPNPLPPMLGNAVGQQRPPPGFSDNSNNFDRTMGNSKGMAPANAENTKYTEITKDKPIRLQVKVLIPVKEHPRFNFVGKLLGPKGNSLKRLQEETMTKMAILGRGSMRDKAKEEELRKQNDPKHAHLTEDLHVEVNAFAPPAEAYGRISHALSEIKKFLDDNDEIRQTQLQELAYINGSAPTTGAPGRGRGRGGAPPPPLGGPAPARTARAGLLATPPPAPRAITTRPGAGGPISGRGVLPPSRSNASRVPPPLPRLASYRPVAEPRTYEDEYDYQESYDQRYADEEGDAQYYDYGHTGAVEPYDSDYAAEDAHYGGGDDWRQATDAPRLKAAPGRATSRGAYRDHPYAPSLPPPPPPPPIPQVSRY